MKKSLNRISLPNGQWFDPSKADRWASTNGNETLYLTPVERLWVLEADEPEELDDETAVRWLLTNGFDPSTIAGIDPEVIEAVEAELEV